MTIQKPKIEREACPWLSHEKKKEESVVDICLEVILLWI